MIDTAKVRAKVSQLLDATREKQLTHEYAHGYLRGSCYVLLEEIDRLRLGSAVLAELNDPQGIS